MTTTNRYKATITLGLVSVGFFMSYPFSDSFTGGLISSACSAAMIGGLADWFAVSALFRRPLGIPFRTAIIPRNREKIFHALIDTVEHELLTAENIRKTLRQYDLTGLLTHYLVEHEGAEDVRRAFAKIVSNIITQVNPDKIGRVVELVVKKNIEKTNIAPILADGIEWLVTHGYGTRITAFIADQMGALAKHDQMRALLVELLTEATKTYERGLARRKLFNILLHVSPGEVAIIVQKLFIVTLTGLKTEDHPIHGKIHGWVAALAYDLRNDSEWQQKVEEWKLKQLTTLHLRQGIASAIQQFRQDTHTSEDKVNWWIELFTRQFDKLVLDFTQNEEKRALFDDQAKQIIAQWVEKHHDAIGDIVSDSLNQFSNEMLIEFIEDKVGDDLQMIRINGSVVGGLLGMVVFLVTFLVK
jgi:uncharacterized membrane-anchored protein YjiN (DUF445 family)